MAIERRMKMLERADGKARIFIIERNDGLFRFEGEAEMECDGDIYWGPCDISGCYASAEEAERAAHHEVLWLRDKNRPDRLPMRTCRPERGGSP